MALSVLYEDNHLLAINKPPGLATMGVSTDRPSLLKHAKQYIKNKHKKPGNVYLGVVSRLDAPVTGVVLLARTSKAAARLTEQFREGRVKKIYWAIVEGKPRPRAAACVDWVCPDQRHRRMHIAAPSMPQAKEARMAYKTLQRLSAATLLEVHLETGRKHQIRLQLAHRGWPIAGDRKYGATTRLDQGIALHARCLELLHPVRQSPIRITAPLPPPWSVFGLG